MRGRFHYHNVRGMQCAACLCSAVAYPLNTCCTLHLCPSVNQPVVLSVGFQSLLPVTRARQLRAAVLVTVVRGHQPAKPLHSATRLEEEAGLLLLLHKYIPND